MFVGHTALALAAKRRAPELSLGWLLAAAYALDLLWPVLLLLGVEQVTFGSATGGFASSPSSPIPGRTRC